MFATLVEAGLDVVEPDGVWTDIGRYAIGRPAAVVRCRDPQDVARAVQIARAAGARVAPLGARTAYWAPLQVEGAVALDLRGITCLRVEDGVAEVGAGVDLRTLDLALRARGRHLPFRPDAFGDTSVVSMVAVGSTSGFGMAMGPISRYVVAIEVVLGDGAIVRTGASGAWPHLPVFLRDGLPDLTGLFLASEGCLGVITRVWLRVPPAPWRARLRCVVRDLDPILPRLRALCEAEQVETARLLRFFERPDQWELDLWLRSPWSADEVAARAAELRPVLGATVEVEDARARAGEGPFWEDTWQGPAGSLQLWARAFQLVGMDVNAPWAALPPLLDLADEIVAEQARTEGIRGGRTALYLAPDFVNLGLHANAAGEPEVIKRTHALMRRRLGELWALGVIPYRGGRSWPDEVWAAIDPHTARLLRAIRDAADPAMAQHPHPLFA